MPEFDVYLLCAGEIDTRHVAARDEEHAWETARRIFIGPDDCHYEEVLAIEPRALTLDPPPSDS